MSAYRIVLFNREGTAATSRVEQSLREAAKTVVTLANYAHDCEPDVLNTEGEADLEVRGLGGRELTNDEKAKLAAMISEYGADSAGSDGSSSSWVLL